MKLSFLKESYMRIDMEKEEHFFWFLLHNSNLKQNDIVVKSMTEAQYVLLRCWTNDILDEIIPLNTRQFNELVQFKDFIRKLGRTRVSATALVKNINVIKLISEIALNVNEVRKKTCASTHRRMGKSKETFTKQRYPEHSGSGSSSSDEGRSIEEQIWGQAHGSREEQEEEEERIFESDGTEEEECNFNN